MQSEPRRKLLRFYVLIVLLETLLFQRVFANEPFKYAYTELDKTYSLFCERKFEEFNQAVNRIEFSHPLYIASRMMALATKKGQEEAIGIAKNLPSDLSSVSQVDRIISAIVFMYPDFYDYSKAKRLLNFNGSSPSVEGYRLNAEASLDLNKNRLNEAYKKKTSAFLMLPYFEDSVLTEIFSLAVSYYRSEDLIKPYYKLIDELPDFSPNKYQLLGWKELVTSNGDFTSETQEYFKKAYETCKPDQSAALSYVPFLIYNKRYDEAEKILDVQSEMNVLRDAYFDLYYAWVYRGKGDSEKFEVFLEKAKKNWDHFSFDYQFDIDPKRAWLEYYWGRILAGLGAFVALLVAVYILIKAKRIRRRSAN